MEEEPAYHEEEEEEPVPLTTFFSLRISEADLEVWEAEATLRSRVSWCC